LILLTNNGSALSQTPLPAAPVPTGANSKIRTDSDTPVLHINTETEFTGGARGIHSQPDGDRFHLWEIAGAAHATKPGVEGTNAKRAKSGLPVGLPPCGSPGINDMDVAVVVKAGLHALWQWAETGQAPTSADRAELSIPETGAATIVRDPATGIAKGGIRVPDVDVPIRTLWGVLPPGGAPFCFLFGAVDPWNGDTDVHDGDPSLDLSPTPEPSLSVLYEKESKYVKAVKDSADGLVDQGFLRPFDAQAIIDRAKTVDIP